MSDNQQAMQEAVIDYMSVKIGVLAIQLQQAKSMVAELQEKYQAAARNMDEALKDRDESERKLNEIHLLANQMEDMLSSSGSADDVISAMSTICSEIKAYLK